MKYFVPFAAAVAALGLPAQAAQIELTLEYDISTFGFAPSNDFSSDDASGFAFPDVGNPDTVFDAGRTNLLLQDVFGNDAFNGGATFDAENNWILDQSLWDFDNLKATFTIDTDDFLKANVIGADPNVDLNVYNLNTRVELYKGETLIEAPIFPSYSTVAADNVDVGSDLLDDEGNPVLGDIIAISVDATEPGSAEIADLDFLFGTQSPDADPVDGNQFESLGADMQALELALTEWISIVEYTEEVIEPDGEAGFFFIQGALQGFDIRSAGVSEEAPLLPDAPAEGEEPSETFGFSVDLATLQEEFEGTPVVWIDPIVATGYVYTIEDADGNALSIAGVVAPSLDFVNDPDGYFVEFSVNVDGNVLTYNEAIAPGEQLFFGSFTEGTVTEFRLTGIDPSLMLDPTNPTLFRTGIIPGRGASGEVRLTQTPITLDYHPDNMAPIPLPLPAAMLLAGLGGLLVVRRKKA